MKCLIGYGVDPLIPDSAGGTLLHRAVTLNTPFCMIDFLVEQGFNLKTPRSIGSSLLAPKDLARDLWNMDLYHHLLHLEALQDERSALDQITKHAMSQKPPPDLAHHPLPSSVGRSTQSQDELFFKDKKRTL